MPRGVHSEPVGLDGLRSHDLAHGGDDGRCLERELGTGNGDGTRTPLEVGLAERHALARESEARLRALEANRGDQQLDA